jgi:ribosomal protein S18 acetylase RimI-like enzyme
MLTVRPATAGDLPAMAAMAARLVHQHHAVDPLRFMLPDDVERGYLRWFQRELASPEVVFRVAERDGRLVGYTYARLEARDWNALLDAHGGLHDIFVDESARGAGAGKALLDATLEGLRRLGAPRVVLSTMWDNAGAQRLFARAGFRRTMVEMTCELPP